MNKGPNSEIAKAVWELKVGEKYVHSSRGALMGAAHRCRQAHPERQFIVRVVTNTYKFYIKREPDKGAYFAKI